MDIRSFFQASTGDIKDRGQKRNKRPYEIPMESPYKGFFAHCQPRAVGESLINKRNKKRAKVEAVRPFQRMKSKLSIMQ